MADAREIADVRENTDERDEEGTWSNSQISDLVDLGGVFAASATIWRRKAASYADLVDVSEAGASHAFSDLYKNALDMANKFDALVASGADVEPPGSSGHARVKVIDRAYTE